MQRPVPESGDGPDNLDGVTRSIHGHLRVHRIGRRMRAVVDDVPGFRGDQDRAGGIAHLERVRGIPQPFPAGLAVVDLVSSKCDEAARRDRPHDLDESVRDEGGHWTHRRGLPRVGQAVVVRNRDVPQREEDGKDHHASDRPTGLPDVLDAAPVTFLTSRLPTLAADVEMIGLAPHQSPRFDSWKLDVAACACLPHISGEWPA